MGRFGSVAFVFSLEGDRSPQGKVQQSQNAQCKNASAAEIPSLPNFRGPSLPIPAIPVAAQPITTLQWSSEKVTQTTPNIDDSFRGPFASVEKEERRQATTAASALHDGRALGFASFMPSDAPPHTYIATKTYQPEATYLTIPPKMFKKERGHTSGSTRVPSLMEDEQTRSSLFSSGVSDYALQNKGLATSFVLRDNGVDARVVDRDGTAWYGVLDHGPSVVGADVHGKYAAEEQLRDRTGVDLSQRVASLADEVAALRDQTLYNASFLVPEREELQNGRFVKSTRLSTPTIGEKLQDAVQGGSFDSQRRVPSSERRTRSYDMKEWDDGGFAEHSIRVASAERLCNYSRHAPSRRVQASHGAEEWADDARAGVSMRHMGSAGHVVEKLRDESWYEKSISMGDTTPSPPEELRNQSIGEYTSTRAPWVPSQGPLSDGVRDVAPTRHLPQSQSGSRDHIHADADATRAKSSALSGTSTIPWDVQEENFDASLTASMLDASRGTRSTEPYATRTTGVRETRATAPLRQTRTTDLRAPYGSTRSAPSAQPAQIHGKQRSHLSTELRVTRPLPLRASVEQRKLPNPKFPTRRSTGASIPDQGPYIFPGKQGNATRVLDGSDLPKSDNIPYWDPSLLNPPRPHARSSARSSTSIAFEHSRLESPNSKFEDSERQSSRKTSPATRKTLDSVMEEMVSSHPRESRRTSPDEKREDAQSRVMSVVSFADSQPSTSAQVDGLSAGPVAQRKSDASKRRTVAPRVSSTTKTKHSTPCIPQKRLSRGQTMPLPEGGDKLQEVNALSAEKQGERPSPKRKRSGEDEEKQRSSLHTALGSLSRNGASPSRKANGSQLRNSHVRKSNGSASLEKQPTGPSQLSRKSGSRKRPSQSLPHDMEQKQTIANWWRRLGESEKLESEEKDRILECLENIQNSLLTAHEIGDRRHQKFEARLSLQEEKQSNIEKELTMSMQRSSIDMDALFGHVQRVSQEHEFIRQVATDPQVLPVAPVNDSSSTTRRPSKGSQKIKQPTDDQKLDALERANSTLRNSLRVAEDRLEALELSNQVSTFSTFHKAAASVKKMVKNPQDGRSVSSMSSNFFDHSNVNAQSPPRTPDSARGGYDSEFDLAMTEEAGSPLKEASVFRTANASDAPPIPDADRTLKQTKKLSARSAPEEQTAMTSKYSSHLRLSSDVSPTDAEVVSSRIKRLEEDDVDIPDLVVQDPANSTVRESLTLSSCSGSANNPLFNDVGFAWQRQHWREIHSLGSVDIPQSRLRKSVDEEKSAAAPCSERRSTDTRPLWHEGYWDKNGLFRSKEPSEVTQPQPSGTTLRTTVDSDGYEQPREDYTNAHDDVAARGGPHDSDDRYASERRVYDDEQRYESERRAYDDEQRYESERRAYDNEQRYESERRPYDDEQRYESERRPYDDEQRYESEWRAYDDEQRYDSERRAYDDEQRYDSERRAYDDEQRYERERRTYDDEQRYESERRAYDDEQRYERERRAYDDEQRYEDARHTYDDSDRNRLQTAELGSGDDRDRAYSQSIRAVKDAMRPSRDEEVRALEDGYAQAGQRLTVDSDMRYRDARYDEREQRGPYADNRQRSAAYDDDRRQVATIFGDEQSRRAVPTVYSQADRQASRAYDDAQYDRQASRTYDDAQADRQASRVHDNAQYDRQASRAYDDAQYDRQASRAREDAQYDRQASQAYDKAQDDRQASQAYDEVLDEHQASATFDDQPNVDRDESRAHFEQGSTFEDANQRSPQDNTGTYMTKSTMRSSLDSTDSYVPPQMPGAYRMRLQFSSSNSSGASCDESFAAGRTINEELRELGFSD